ncbi:peptide ABC transporter ATPase [Burkholderia lata]|uniref:peptide ABC transporter ATPase n=1 Tax=Burkholderia lata (strain ATCC 17760 / DSM 23089 / LMG 22485 / NCIMB 9086 / R18194 / 383) TaxID=482957 RepID=UPI001452AA62|nr:peptide ABC transporter ATPase [Burkholderia lata]VWD42857.1 peptide ABC transporter ATPase [Burkholderia lata]
MTKPDSLKGDIKGQAQEADRHNLARPAANGALWARGLTTQRVADLFRTPGGLRGHWMQIQNEVNAGNRYFYGVQNGNQTTDEGKELIRWIADSVISAAQRADFDFPLYQLQFTADTGWLKVQRVSGRVMVLSRP